jgi:hypothetical protein
MEARRREWTEAENDEWFWEVIIITSEREKW